MSIYFYEKELGGERETALKIVSSIEADFQRWAGSGQKDAPKNCLKYAQNLLSTFYTIYRTAKEKAHYDIFVDIYVRILSPKLEASASPIHFKQILTFLEHLFSTLASFKLHAECAKLYECITKQQLKLKDVDDFKTLLCIHGTNLLLLCKQSAAANKTQPMDAALASLTELLQFFSQHATANELTANDCTNTFIKSLKMNTSQGRTLLVSNLNKSQKLLLFTAFFELLANVSNKPVYEAANAANESFKVQLKVMSHFFKFDEADNYEQQLVLQYAKTGIAGAQHEDIVCAAKYLRNLLKLCYVRVMVNNFKENYQICCAGYRKLLAQSSKNVWYEEFVLLVFLLLNSMQPTPRGGLKIFWAQLNDAQLFCAHFELLAALQQALAKTTQSEIFQYKCCGKEMFSRHCQQQMAWLAMETYSLMLKTQTFVIKEEAAINVVFEKILNCALSAYIDMDSRCHSVQHELWKFNAHFTNLMKSAESIRHACYFIELAQQHMKQLKSQLSNGDRELLMRRLYQLGAKTYDPPKAAELHCYYIAELIASNKDSYSASILLHNQVHFFHTGIPAGVSEYGICLIDVYMLKCDDGDGDGIRSNQVFKPLLKKHQLRLLHWIDLQYVVKNYKADTHVELYSIFARRSLTNYDFLLVVNFGNLYERSTFKSKIENIYARLNETKTKEKLKRMDELILAHAAYMLWMARNMKRVNRLHKSDFIEDNLAKLMLDKALIDLNLQNEMETLKLALDALKAFKAFYEKADIEALDPHDGGYLDWSRILDDLTSLAQYFQITGYLDYALEAWLLHYRISKTIDDTLNSVRSLAFLCEFNQLIQHAEQRLDIAKELATESSKLVCILNTMPQILRRHQTLTLTCLCQIAYFYATNGRLEEANLYLRYVRKSHAKLERNSNSNDYDIVLFTADIVQFRMQWKCVAGDAGDADRCQQQSTILFKQFEMILERLENFVYISSVDKTLFDTLLISAVTDFAEFIGNRLIDNKLSAFFACCLKLSVDSGAAIFTAKLLAKWAAINLQMEYLKKAEIKFLLIECILGLRDVDEVSKMLMHMKKSDDMATAKNDALLPQSAGLEVVRKVVVNTHKTLKINSKQGISAMAFDLKLNRYLDSNQNEVAITEQDTATASAMPLVYAKATHLLWTRFNLGIVRARFNFLAKNNDELAQFYEDCHKWLAKRRNTLHYKLFMPEIMWCTSNHANFLRATQKFDKAKQLLASACKEFKTFENIDSACLLNLEQQLLAIDLEVLELKNRVLPKRKKQLPATPTLPTLPTTSTATVAKLPTTPLNKTTRYAQLPMTVGAQPKKTLKTSTPAFKIFSDRKVAHKPAEKQNFLQHTCTKKDLKFNDTEAKPPKSENSEIIVLGDMEKMLETPKLSNPTTSAVPKFIFTEVIDLEHDEPKLEVIDLVDDEPKPQAKVRKNSKVSKTKTGKSTQAAVELGIERGLEQLTIESATPTALNGETKQLAPITPTFAEADFEKSSVQAAKTTAVTKTRATQKRSKKQTTSPCSSVDAKDTCSNNSNEPQSPTLAASRRRPRARTVAVAECAKSTASNASSRLRPR